jgi:hypothetical protein
VSHHRKSIKEDFLIHLFCGSMKGCEFAQEKGQNKGPVQKSHIDADGWVGGRVRGEKGGKAAWA